MLVVALLLFTETSGCAALRPPLTSLLRRAEAKRVTSQTRHRVLPSEVSYVLANPTWRLVFATPRDAERGVFIFRRAGSGYRLVDVWGGFLSKDEKGQAAAWARGLAGGGVPPPLAACMDEALRTGR